MNSINEYFVRFFNSTVIMLFIYLVGGFIHYIQIIFHIDFPSFFMFIPIVFSWIFGFLSYINHPETIQYNENKPFSETIVTDITFGSLLFLEWGALSSCILYVL